MPHYYHPPQSAGGATGESLHVVHTSLPPPPRSSPRYQHLHPHYNHTSSSSSNGSPQKTAKKPPSFASFDEPQSPPQRRSSRNSFATSHHQDVDEIDRIVEPQHPPAAAAASSSWYAPLLPFPTSVPWSSPWGSHPNSEATTHATNNSAGTSSNNHKNDTGRRPPASPTRHSSSSSNNNNPTAFTSLSGAAFRSSGAAAALRIVTATSPCSGNHHPDADNSCSELDIMPPLDRLTDHHRNRSDATPVASNVTTRVSGPSWGQKRSEPPTTRAKNSNSSGDNDIHDHDNDLDDSQSTDDLTVSRINVSDTDLLRSESPGCLRLTEHGLKALEEQTSAATTTSTTDLPTTVAPRWAARRHSQPPLRRRLPASASAPSIPRIDEGHQDDNDGASLRRSSVRSLPNAPPHSLSPRGGSPHKASSMDWSPPLSSSSPRSPSSRRDSGRGTGGHHHHNNKNDDDRTTASRLWRPFRSSRGGGPRGGASDECSVTPLGDTDKMVLPPPPSNNGKASSSSSPRRGLFCRANHGHGPATTGRRGGKVKSGGGGGGGFGHPASSSASEASRRHLEQVSAQEARERELERRKWEARDRTRIEEKRRAYLQHQRAKERTARDHKNNNMSHDADHDLESALGRPSSSKTAATVQSTICEDDSYLREPSQRLRGGGGGRSTSTPLPQPSQPLFRDFAFSLTECPGVWAPPCDYDPTHAAPSTVGLSGGGTAASGSVAAAAAVLPPCTVCHLGDRTHIATPCLHLAYCRRCARKLTTCAVCHRPADFRPVNL